MTVDPRMIEMMYWMNDENWYTFDPHQDVEYHLTAAAPERAQKAYNEWLALQKTST